MTEEVLPPLSTAAKHLDAELLRLNAEFDTAFAIERASTRSPLSDDDLNSIVQSVGVVVDQILMTPAETLEGLGVKAKALAWTNYGTPNSDDPETTTDSRILWSIARDMERKFGSGELWCSAIAQGEA